MENGRAVFLSLRDFRGCSTRKKTLVKTKKTTALVSGGVKEKETLPQENKPFWTTTSFFLQTTELLVFL